MPGKKKGDSSKDGVDYKAKLEQKLCTARETPDLVFDLSECNLKTVPTGIFSICRVLRKEALYLQNNFLTSLSAGGSLVDLRNLKTLDISDNNFTSLPPDIDILENLEVLDASKNGILKLPESIGNLINLEWLNVAHNKLQQIPASIEGCKNLKVLNLTFNKILKLPPSLGKIKELQQIEIDPIITYPPKDVCKKGVHAILSYLEKDASELLKVDLDVPSTSTNPNNYYYKKESFENVFDTLQEQVKIRDQIKSEKQKQILEIEKKLRESNDKEVQLQNELKSKKKALLAEIKLQQQKLDNELNKIQLKKDSDHAFLLHLLTDEEKKTNEIVHKLLESNKKFRQNVFDSWEKEKNLDEVLFNKTLKDKTVERKEILDSMDKIMKEEIKRVQQNAAGSQAAAVASLAGEVSKQNNTLQDLLKKFNENQSQLIESCLQNEEVQKSAVAALLEKTDGASYKLAKEIAFVESQLAELTKLEITKKKLQTEIKLDDLSKNRIGLAMLLQDLLEKQAMRRHDLVEKIRKMETIKESAKNQDSFWMDQYEKLLKSKSHNLVEFLNSVNPKLAHEMFVHGVFHFLLKLKDFIGSEKKIKELDEKKLAKLGVKSADDRKCIMNAIESYLEHERNRSRASSVVGSSEPSVHVITDHPNPHSITFLVADECVVCLQFKPNVIFVPCGHLCCCYTCYSSIKLCPLCRSPIETVIDGKKKI